MGRGGDAKKNWKGRGVGQEERAIRRGGDAIIREVTLSGRGFVSLDRLIFQADVNLSLKLLI